MINNEQRIAKIDSRQYQQLFGVTKATFEEMLSALNGAYIELHAMGGKPPKLSVLDKLIITLCYWREYRTYRHIAFDYDVGKTAIGNSILWVETTLLASKAFTLPSKRAFEKHNDEIEIIVVDVTEQEIERPKRGKKSGIQARKNGTR